MILLSVVIFKHYYYYWVSIINRFPVWLCRVIAKLCRSWNTRVMVVTRKGKETSEPIRFNKGLPQGDALCPRLFAMCLNPIAWKISATEGYRLSKPISFKVTDLPHIDDLKIFTASASKLNRVMNMVKTTMEDVGLAWNLKKCAVVHARRGVHVSGNSGVILDETASIPSLEDGKQYKFLGVLESVMQEDKLVLECAAKEYLRRMSVIWTSPLSDHNRVTASNSLPCRCLVISCGRNSGPVARMRFFTYREIREVEVYVR